MDIKELDSRYVLNTYGRQPEATLRIEKGSGSRVWDDKGKEYLDLVTGLAVNSLGHCHPKVVEAIQEQAETLMHTSNLYYTAPQAQLAQRLAENSLGGKVFFANSGGEVNEAAIKLARKFYREQSGEDRYQIITAENSFHGRTMATLTATGQTRYQKDFQPLLEGFHYAPFNRLDAFSELVGEKTCAVMIEPVQGEGGVYPADPEFLRGLRRLCDEKGLLLIFDEIQCGVGRTGSLWAYQEYGVEPDILTSAKALGGGLPLGAMICREELAAGLGPGDHASTFGGNPVSCRAALAVLQVLLQEGLLAQVKARGEEFREKLRDIDKSCPGTIKEIRGQGLMLGIELHEPRAKEVQRTCMEKGLLVNAIGERIIRLLPPFVITSQEVNTFARIFQESLETGS